MSLFNESEQIIEICPSCNGVGEIEHFGVKKSDECECKKCLGSGRLVKTITYRPYHVKKDKKRFIITKL